MCLTGWNNYQTLLRYQTFSYERFNTYQWDPVGLERKDVLKPPSHGKKSPAPHVSSEGSPAPSSVCTKFFEGEKL